MTKTMDKIQADIQRFIDDLFTNCPFIARIELDVPNSNYCGVIKTLKEYEELLRQHGLRWAFIKEDIGFKLIIDRTNKDITGTKIDAMELLTYLINNRGEGH